MPHFDSRRTIRISAEEAVALLISNLESIKDVSIINRGNPIEIERERRITANRNAMKGSVLVDGDEIRISLDGLGSMHQKFAKEIWSLFPADTIDDQGVSSVLASVEKSTKFFGALEINNLIEDLRSGETLIFLTNGTHDNRQCIIMLTDQRVLFKDTGIGSKGLKEFDPLTISSIESGRKMTGDFVKLTVSGNEISASVIPHGRGIEFAEKLRALRENLNLTNEPSNQHQTEQSIDVAQLSKLADLHASGILNDEEFAAAKARILGL